MKGLLITCLLLIITLQISQAKDDMMAFPEAEAGMIRHVLFLPGTENESDLKVELMAGKTVQTDEENHYFFSGKIEAENIIGWGYTRYNVSRLGAMAGTLMAVDPAAPKVTRFIPLGGEPFFIRYNSRLPIVVYAPEDVEVRYRLWRAEAGVHTIDKG